MDWNNKEERNKYNREYYKQNKPKIKERYDKYYQDNKEKVNAKNKKWNENNKEKFSAYVVEYRKTEKAKKSIKNWKENNKDKIKESWQRCSKTPENRYKAYKKGAMNRKIEFLLTFEQFMTFWQKPCFYGDCKIETVGLDRIDSTKGYTIENCQPCCSRHNRMKSDMSKEEFLDACLKVVNKLSVKNNKEAI